MIRIIVVPIDGSEYDNKALEMAGDIAGLWMGGVFHKVTHVTDRARLTVK